MCLLTVAIEYTRLFPRKEPVDPSLGIFPQVVIVKGIVPYVVNTKAQFWEKKRIFIYAATDQNSFCQIYAGISIHGTLYINAIGLRHKGSEVTLALLGKSADILPFAERHHIPWIHAEHTTVSRETIARAHSGGIRVNVWTVDDPETLLFWQEIGADKICTNRPARMLGANQKMA